MKRSNLAWSWKPDSATSVALKRGNQKIRKAYDEKGEVLGTDRPHYGGIIETKSTQPAEKAKGKKHMATKTTNNAKTASKKRTTAAPAPVKSEGNKTPLKRICSDLKIEPRLARRKLRNAGLKFHDSRDRWNFTAAQVPKVKEILAPATN